MKTHNPNIYWLLLAGAAVLSGGCDKTVGIDAMRPSFSKLLVPSACQSSDDLSVIDISLLLLDGRTSIFPDDRLQFETETIGKTLKPDSFKFSEPLSETPVGYAGIISKADNTNFADGKLHQSSDLHPTEISYLYSGGEARKDDRRLIILLLDHSASLVGQEVTGEGTADAAKATDSGDGRISFFKQLISNLDAHDYISLAWFNGHIPTFDLATKDGYTQPTVNREITKEGLESLSRGESGETPLADALDYAFDKIIAETYKDLNPIVILFTDGVEEGDSSQTTLAEVTDKYVNKLGESVPVIVLELQPPSAVDPFGTLGRRGRHGDLVNLACETGGEYFFINSANQFTDNSSNLELAVRNRLVGTWRLKTTTELSDLSRFNSDQAYLLSTSLTVTLGDKSRSAELVQSPDSTSDSRLWFYKK